MKKEIQIIKHRVFILKTIYSLEGGKLYLKIIKLFQKYFKYQSLQYQANILGVEKLEKDKKDIEENFKKQLEIILQQIYEEGQEKSEKEIQENFENYGYEKSNIVIDNKKAVEYATLQGGALIAGVNQTTKKEIGAIMADGFENALSIKEIARNIKNKFDKFSLYRATLIAQQETAMAFSEARSYSQKKYAKKLGVVGWKRARTQGDSKVRDTHKQNEREGWIPRNKKFFTGHENTPFDFNCRCHIEYSHVNPKSGLLYDKSNPNYKTIQPKAEVFTKRLKELAGENKISIKSIKKFDNKYHNLMSYLSYINKNIPGKRDGKSGKAKTDIYFLKNNALKFLAYQIDSEKIKGKYIFKFDKKRNMPGIYITIGKIRKGYHIKPETKKEIKQNKKNLLL